MNSIELKGKKCNLYKQLQGKENEEAFTASFKEANKTLILKLDKGCINMYVWLGPFTVHLKLPQHCLLISYTPIQN